MTDWSLRHGKRLLEQGGGEIQSARYLALSVGDRHEAENKARAGLATLWSAMNWLEDTIHFEEAHRTLDRAGRFVRETFGCFLSYDDGKYEQRCPVALAHKRLGFSIGGIIRDVECSICGLSPDDCEHIIGRVYNGQLCGRIIKDFDLREISLVSRPRQPNARLSAIPLGTMELQEHLGPRWTPGMRVSCDRCLSDCDGVEELSVPP